MRKRLSVQRSSGTSGSHSKLPICAIRSVASKSACSGVRPDGEADSLKREPPNEAGRALFGECSQLTLSTESAIEFHRPQGGGSEQVGTANESGIADRLKAARARL